VARAIAAFFLQMRDRLSLTPRQYSRLALIALTAMTVIVFTGAAVRLTGSGLGCPTWPKCTSTHLYTPLRLHGLIEFSNRTFGAIVTLTALATVAGARLRRPYRRDLFLLSLLLPLGVVAQAVLGGLTVLYDLKPEWVAPHFALSMLVLVPAVVLAWRARREPGEAPAIAVDRTTALAVRALLPLGALAIAAGTLATAAGPHAGGEGTHDVVRRVTWWGSATLERLVHYHGTIAMLFGLAAVGTWWLARHRRAPEQVREALTVTCVLLAAQGVVGSAQYAMKLPAEMVWVHVVLATLTWLSVVWSTVLVSARAPEPSAALSRQEAQSRRGDTVATPAR
jgi:cytochrome c oxidase assembly protein subunit 15